MTEMFRRIEKPGVSVGTRIRLARRWGAASGSVTAMQTANAAPSADDANHLWPRITQSPPSRFAVVPIHTGFEPANSGSVIVKQLRISPATSGRSQRSFCAVGAVPEKELHVPDVRRLHVERVVPERRAAQLLAHVRELDEGEPGAAPRRGKVRREEARAARAAADVLERGRDRVPALVQELRLERNDFLLDEIARELTQALQLFGLGKIHGILHLALIPVIS